MIRIKTLYIIGNGFDIAHGLKTNYWNMREHIMNNDSEFLLFFEELYDIQPLDDTEPWYTDDIQKKWNRTIDHNLWSTFEYSIGNPNTTKILDLSISVTEGISSSTTERIFSNKIRSWMDSYWEDHFKFIDKLQSHIKNWIESIVTDNITPKNKNLINSSDLFFTFNYTDILEKVYGINNVTHIHGNVSSISENPPIIGHSNNTLIEQHKQWSKEAANENIETEASIQYAISVYLNKIFKDTNKQILYNKDFFNKLTIVNQVIIIGWSGGDVDLPYLYEIIRKVNKNAKWKVYWHSDRDYKSLINIFENIKKSNKILVSFYPSNIFWNL